MKCILLLLLCVIYTVLNAVGGVHGGPVNATTTTTPVNGTREFSTAYDCKWVMKCAHEQTGEPFYNPCKQWQDPKYECRLKPNVDLSEPPCLLGYVLNEKNKCVNILI